MGHFKLIKKTQLDEITDQIEVPESDYSLLSNNDVFYQFKYHESERKLTKYDVKPGLWKIVKTNMGCILEPASFVKDQILEEFVNTKNIEEIVGSFFNNLHMYAEFGMEIPKRNLLLWGPPGTGKSTSIGKCVAKYIGDGETAAITWDTNALEAYDVKYFISTFNYVGVKKLILIAEDIGGLEMEGVRTKTDSSLLSLLDNADKTFTIPIMIISTTNHPSNLEETLANRSGRFDDKIEVGTPPAEARIALLKFFSKEQASQEALDLIGSKTCEKFPPAHIREAWIRSRLRNKPLIDIIKDIVEEIKVYEKAFEKKRRDNMGF